MNVFEFEKSLLERMNESRNVLQCKGSSVPASEVREEWACHVELKIEPAGKIHYHLFRVNIFIEIIKHKIYKYVFFSMYKKVGKPFGN